jgi:hypothetical protein
MIMTDYDVIRSRYRRRNGIKVLMYKIVLLDFVHLPDFNYFSCPSLRRAQSGGTTDRLSALFPPFLPEDGSRIQLPKRSSFIIL